VEERNIVIGVS